MRLWYAILAAGLLFCLPHGVQAHPYGCGGGGCGAVGGYGCGAGWGCNSCNYDHLWAGYCGSRCNWYSSLWSGGCGSTCYSACAPRCGCLGKKLFRGRRLWGLGCGGCGIGLRCGCGVTSYGSCCGGTSYGSSCCGGAYEGATTTVESTETQAPATEEAPAAEVPEAPPAVETPPAPATPPAPSTDASTSLDRGPASRWSGLQVPRLYR